MRNARRKRTLQGLWAAAALLLGACTPEPLVRHPDAPMLIRRARGEHLRVAVYDRTQNKLVDAGWIETEALHGWTLHRFDWEEFTRHEEPAHD